MDFVIRVNFFLWKFILIVVIMYLDKLIFFKTKFVWNLLENKTLFIQLWSLSLILKLVAFETQCNIACFWKETATQLIEKRGQRECITQGGRLRNRSNRVILTSVFPERCPFPSIDLPSWLQESFDLSGIWVATSYPTSRFLSGENGVRLSQPIRKQT